MFILHNTEEFFTAIDAITKSIFFLNIKEK